MKPVIGITQREITKQWDRVAKLRAEQIRRGKDLSFNFVLVPTILQLSTSSDFTSVIDIGCGPGFLTEQLALKAQHIIGIDMSEEMIKLAKGQCASVMNVEFINSTIENFARNIKPPPFTLAISNMSLMTALHLDGVLQSVACVLRPKGHFVFTITHPCFWPFYWGYASKEWFDYKKEVLIEDVFRISLESPKDGVKTTHAHRPLEQYIVSLCKAGFAIDEICEPMPAKDIEVKYPEPWRYPRFLGMRCIKIR
ncbi:MAG: class I SAM-dependent methyltransferase [Dehalococcoidales bacterium]|nr:class I SAM-dependent methyltransferase [Dehalococcoidales bacterium]